MGGGVPDPDYVRCAVGTNKQQRCWYYFRGPSDRGLTYRRQIKYWDHDLIYPGTIQLVFRVLFMGLEFLVVPESLDNIKPALVDHDPEAFDADWKERPTRIQRSNRPGIADTGFLNFTTWDRPS